MAKSEGWMWIGLIVVAVVLLGNQSATTPPAGGSGGSGGTGGSGGSNIDLCSLVDGKASFTAAKTFLAGTAVPTEYVHVIRKGSVMDLGQFSLNSGTLSTTPGANYKLYFGENASVTAYYTDVQDYTAPCKDATDNKVGSLCVVDTTPTISVFTENGAVQDGTTTNVQAVGSGETVTMEVKVKAASQKCYGNPGSPKDNAICFDYNSTAWTSVIANTPSQSTPYNISSYKPAGKAQICYALNKLKNTESQTISVTLKAQTGINPAGNGNVTVKIKDVGFDLDANTLDEIWDYQDESNNRLGALPTSAVIHIS